jgi:hypothetical protein
MAEFSETELEFIEEVVAEYQTGADGYDFKLSSGILAKIDEALNG